MTRLTKEQVIELAETYKLSAEHIFITLAICKGNLSYRYASCLFGFGISSISYIFNGVFDQLFDKLVPDFLGSAWSRADIKKHTPQYVNDLYSLSRDQVAITCDGFPIYIEKPGEFDIQKLTYSGKSKRNAVTFHGCVCLDGSFIYVNGPYGSDGYNNDQNIFDSLFDREYNQEVNRRSNNNSNSNSNNADNSNESERGSVYIYRDDQETLWLSQSLIREGDVVILDRGTNYKQ